MLKTKTKGLSSGSTLLNLACTNLTKSCFLPGHYYLFVGDSMSGKTFLALTCLAEACQDPAFANYDIVFDNSEHGALMDITKYFGKSVAERLQPPSTGANDIPVYSETVEELYYHLHDRYENKKPFIYIVDSMDALTSSDEQETFEKQKKAHRKGREGPGSYGTSKAKANSHGLREAMSQLPKTGSILIVICQTRDAIGQFGFGDKKTRAGGRALRFYATLEIWSSIKGPIKKKVRGKERKVGICSKVQVKKNRILGRDRTVMIPIINNLGIDDVGSMIDYLVEEGYWKTGSGGIRAKDFELTLPREQLITKIEDEDLEINLRNLTGKVWKSIESELEVKRKPRYS